MTSKTFRLSYPRKRFNRLIIRLIGKLILPVLFRIKINGKENFPGKGPLLVVGNHTAAMEAVLLNIFSPWQIEMLSAADTPAEPIVEIFAFLYGVIPLHRGSYDRAALDSALDVLKQDGVIGLFPEGGIWEVGKKKALTGISWLSYRSGAPVLPIGFNDTTGAINQGLKLKRPTLTMDIGQIIQPAVIPKGTPRKEYFQTYADRVMEEVYQLIPEEDYHAEPEIIDETFDLQIMITDQAGNRVQDPGQPKIMEELQLTKFLHRPALLKIFSVNLELPVHALQDLKSTPSTQSLRVATKAVLEYLRDENPYLLTYRFGVKGGLAMQRGLEQLYALLCWCDNNAYQIRIIPTRYYYSLKDDKKVTQIDQGNFQSWM